MLSPQDRQRAWLGQKTRNDNLGWQDVEPIGKSTMDFNLTCIGVRISPGLNRLQKRINARIDEVRGLPCVGSFNVCEERDWRCGL